MKKTEQDKLWDIAFESAIKLEDGEAVEKSWSKFDTLLSKIIKQAEQRGRENLVGRIKQALEWDWYHKRGHCEDVEYPPYALTAWDDRNRFINGFLELLEKLKNAKKD